MVLFKNLWDTPMMKKIIIITGAFLGVFIFLMMFVSCSSNGKTYTYEELEELLVEKVMRKYSDSTNLPAINESTEVSMDSLVAVGVMSSLKDYTKNGESCFAKVTIYNNNGYYLYVPSINCAASYKTKTLSDTLINDSLVTSGNGLYLVNDEYIFKGDNVKNFIKVNDRLYKIIKINKDGSVKLLTVKSNFSSPWDNRYNIDRNSNVGINNYFYNNINSRIKEKLEEVYNDESIYTKEDKAYFIPKEFCVGKRSINESDNSGNIECSVLSPKQPLGLISLYEYFNASLDPNCNAVESESCTNYNYFDNDINSYWTSTADKDTTHKVFKILSGSISLTNANSSTTIKPVVNINGDNVIKGGSGTEEDPYTI